MPFLDFSMFLWLIMAGIIFVILILFFLLKSLFRDAIAENRSLGRVTLLVTLPKERGKEEEKKETKETINEAIGIAETFFAAIGGLKPEKGIKAWLLGRDDHFSFEIAADQNLISFYLVIPRRFTRFIEQQIHAHWPEANIEELEEYNIFSPICFNLGVCLALKRPWYLPIKTYQKIETDPLNALTNVLSKIKEPEGAVIQYLVRSSKKGWRRKGIKVASDIQQGKKSAEVIKGKNLAGGAADLIGGGVSSVFKHIFSSPSKQKQDLEKKKEHRLSPMEEEMVKGIESKASKAGMDVNIRVVVSAQNQERAKMYLDNIVNAFSQYNIYHYGNVLGQRSERKSHLIRDFIYRRFEENKKNILNTEEMASLFHFPLPFTETPNVNWLLAKRAAAPANTPTEGILLGENIYRGVKTPIKIKRDDRRRHTYIIGMTGMGKSVLISNMAVQDIKNGEGVCIIDPHGDLADDVLAGVPKERIDDVVYFEPSDMERPVGLNMLDTKSPEEKDFSVQEMIAIFMKLFPPEIIGPMFEHNMRNAMLTLMADSENPGTLAEIPRIFTDTDFQKALLAKVTDPMVRAFWEKEMAKTTEYHKSEMLGYLVSKVGRFVENDMMRNIIGQSRSGIDFEKIMNEGKVLIVNLSKGKTGEVNSNLLGLIIVSKLQMAAMRRASLPREQRRDFYLYIDEFQNFITDSVATILSEARKYMLNLIIAHQYIGQLVQGQDTKIRDAVFGNVGSKICFRIGVEDAETMAKEFAPVFNEYDVINIEKFNAYVKLLIDNQASRPFNMATIPPEPSDPSYIQKIKEISRLKYGRDRRAVEAEILDRSKLGESLQKAKTEDIEKTL